jgi:CRP-like cAMP-binding protein
LLLSALPARARALLIPGLRDRALSEGTMLWDAGEPPDRIYFPSSGMISIVVPTRDGHGLEVGTIGQEAAVGCHDGLAPTTTVTRAIVQIAGTFTSIAVHEFVAAMKQSDELRRMVSVCRDWLLVQAQQTAVCNAIHSADARFSRWLLRASDATGSDVIGVTQEIVAEMLGVRRTTITLIAQNLQAAGIIKYRRGVITIRDRAALETAAGESYQAIGKRLWPSTVLAESERIASSSGSGSL